MEVQTLPYMQQKSVICELVHQYTYTAHDHLPNERAGIAIPPHS